MTRVLAIDPGYERLGVAVIDGPATKEVLVYSTCITTSATLPNEQRLGALGAEIRGIIETHKPNCVAMETLFLTKNQKTAMLVSASRGVILFLAAQHGLNVFEYAPLQIKRAITGYGKSDKKQIMAMVERLISIPKKITHDDEYDAIAVGLTCLASEKNLQ